MSDVNEMNDGGALRKELEKALAKNKELAEQLQSFEKKEHQRGVESFLKDKGFNPKLAKFVPADAKDPEQLDAWVRENAELFGSPAGEANQEAVEASGESAVPEESREAYQKIQRTSQAGAAAPVDLSALQAQIAATQNKEELNALLARYDMA